MLVYVGGALALLAVLALVYKFVAGGSGSTVPPIVKRSPAPAVATSGGSGAPAPIVPRARLPSDQANADSGPLITVWFGSQTGTAEGFAKQLAKDGAKAGFRAKAVDLEGFTPEKLVASGTGGNVAVFVMATYGEGDPTDNAVPFAKWLQDDATAAGKPLKGFRFTVFGLGNRQYERYNYMGKLTNEKLAALGGTRVYAHGEGDDEGNMEEDWDGWREGGLWEAVRAATGSNTAPPSPVAPPASGAGAAAPPPLPDALPWRVTPVAPPTDKAALAAGHAMPAAAREAASHHADVASRHFFAAVPAPVVVNRELRQAPGVGASTRHVEVDLAGTGLSYTTADNAFIVPMNDDATVAAVAGALKLDLNAWFTVAPAAGDDTTPPFPVPCSVRTLLGAYTDLHGAPKRDLLAQLAPYAGAAADRVRLARLGSKEGKDDFHAWVVDAQRSVAEVLAAFPSLALPLEAVVGVLPRQTYRAYTIASSSVVHPGALALCASVIDAPKPGGDASRRLRGVCSNQLARLAGAPSPRLLLYVRPSTFHLPAQPSAPVIMVGPGTGLAPMRAFLQERHYQRSVMKAAVGPTVLFFGCRNRDEDFIYRDELEGYARDGTLTGLHLAFSRETSKKVYVQHLIEEQGEQMWALLTAGGHVYVCGATKMGHDVLKAFENVAAARGKLAPAAAAAFVNELKAKKRYIQELWTS